MLKRTPLLFVLAALLLLGGVAGWVHQPVVLAEPANYDCAAQSDIPETECEALVALYNATDGDNWTTNTGWLTTNTPCSWYTITCNGGHIQFVQLSQNSLSGVVPPEIGNLSNLELLSLGSSQLTALPPEIGNLSNLVWLNLDRNQLTALPPEIGNLSSLTSLNLSGNQLTALPPEIWNLTSLTSLNLLWNQLTALPPGIGNLSSLVELDLFRNQLTAVPPEIGNLSSLESIGLDRNQLTAVPPEIGNLSSLVELDLNDNQLTAVPPEIGNLSSLVELDLNDNQLTAVPPEIGNLSSLVELDLVRNQLTAVPPEIGNLSSLERLLLSSNQLTAVPPEISNLSSLTSLSLNRNQLTAVPPEIWNLTGLTNLGLDGNQLTAVPPEIGNLSNLVSLGLGDNHLTAVPPEIGNLTISGLSLDNNQLTALPPEIWDLSLTNLNLDNNQLTAVPSEINGSNLRRLSLDNNQITLLPTIIGDFVTLEQLNVSNNPLSGSLPSWLTALVNLNEFVFNGTAWCVPNDAGMQNWLDSIISGWDGTSGVYGTGFVCGEAPGSMVGTVSDINGQPLVNVQVILYRSSLQRFSYTVVDNTYTNGIGQYTFGNLGQGISYLVKFQDTTGTLAREYYSNSGYIPSAAPITITLGMSRTINAQLGVLQPPRVNVGLGSSGVTTSTDPATGLVLINVPTGQATDLTITYSASCNGGSTPSAVVLNYNNQQYPMSANAGLYSVMIPANDVVTSDNMLITTTCNGTDSASFAGYVTLFDPNGIITDAETNQPVEGARVILYQVPGWLPRTGPTDTRPNRCESNNSKADGASWSQPAPTDEGIMVDTPKTRVAPLTNYQYTNDVGYYGWNVSEGVPFGCWYVTVQADGYEPLTSPVVGVPPEVTDFDLVLQPALQEGFEAYLPMITR